MFICGTAASKGPFVNDGSDDDNGLNCAGVVATLTIEASPPPAPPPQMPDPKHFFALAPDAVMLAHDRSATPLELHLLFSL